jgi:hypothetical protein
LVDPQAFIFTLANHHGIHPTRYSVLSHHELYAIHHSDTHGSIFGGGYDICACMRSNANQNIWTNISHSYEDTTGKGGKAFTGEKIYVK